MKKEKRNVDKIRIGEIGLGGRMVEEVIAVCAVINQICIIYGRIQDGKSE